MVLPVAASPPWWSFSSPCPPPVCDLHAPASGLHTATITPSSALPFAGVLFQVFILLFFRSFVRFFLFCLCCLGSFWLDHVRFLVIFFLQQSCNCNDPPPMTQYCPLLAPHIRLPRRSPILELLSQRLA
jgi:hypothetical protein